MPETFCVPYQDALRTGTRPYVSTTLTAPRGVSLDMIGMVDSGADLTVLPTLTAALLGLGKRDLEPAKIQQLSGGHDALRARRPIVARPRGLNGFEFEIRPVFAEGLRALWGREDYFAAFESVAFDEQGQQLMLVVP